MPFTNNAAGSSTNLVGSVTNAIDSVQDRWANFIKKLIDFSEAYGMRILGAVLIFIAGLIVARWLGNALRRWLERQQMEPPVRTLLVRVTRLLVMIFTGVMVLDKFGVPVATLVAGIGVAGVGLGLALQGVLSNLVAGLTIIFTKPFRVGEYVEIASVHGQVTNIELFSTVLRHNDLSTVVIPNKKIVGEILHNYGTIRQLNLSVGVAYGSDLNTVLSILREIVSTNPRVLKSPAPALGITSLSDSAISIAVKPWTNVPDYGAAQAEIYQAIIDRFREQQIEIPFPQREVRLLQNDDSQLLVKPPA
jgi:small conductance mechanosensitive channel